MIVQSSVSLTIRAFPRLHVTLIDLSGGTLRRNGGAGLAIDGPPTIIQANVSETDSLITPPHFDPMAASEIKTILNDLRELAAYPPTIVRIIDVPTQHVGFGTKTCTVLAALQAVVSLHSLNVHPSQMQAISKRGGTSGIGIWVFFEGGFVADSGHPQVPSRTYSPSSFAVRTVLPVPIVRLTMPKHWRCHLILPEGNRRSGADEASFFVQNTPILTSEVLEVLAAVYHGVCPAIATGDLALLRCALAQIHRSGFKARELAGQPAAVGLLVDSLNQNPNIAAGMSSMGPLVYAVTEQSDRLMANALAAVCSEYASSYLGAVGFRNEGFEIIK